MANLSLRSTAGVNPGETNIGAPLTNTQVDTNFINLNTDVLNRVNKDGTTVMTGSLQLGAGLGIIFEGTTADASETTLVAGEPTSDRTITLPNATTTLVGTDASQTLTNKTIALGSNTVTGTSAQLASAISDETGSGALVFASSPTLTTPVIEEITGTAILLNATGNVTLDAGGASVLLKDDGTTFGSLVQSGGELVIKSGSTPTTALTFSGANIEVAGDITVTGNDVKMNGGTTALTFSGSGDVTVAGDLTVSGNDIKSSSATVFTMSGADVVAAGKVKATTSLAVGSGLTASATNGRIDAANDVVAFSTSDERLKTNIALIENALTKVTLLRGVEFTWDEATKEHHGYEGKDTGVIAQDVAQVLPEVVQVRDNGYMAVKYEKMIGLLIEAIKELNAKVEINKCNCAK